MKLSEGFNMYMQSEIVARGGSPNTYEQYRYALKSAIHFFGDVKVKKITPSAIEDFYITLVKTEVINGRKHDSDTARGYVSCLKSVFGMLCRRGYRVADPAAIVVPKRRKKSPAFLTRIQVDKVVEVLSTSKRGYPRLNLKRNVLMAKMLFCTGIRVGELCALNRNSIRDKKFIVVGKSKEPRVCFITQEVEDLIDDYLSERTDGNEALFVSNQTGGKRISIKTVQQVFRRASKQAGIHVHPHTLRHSFGTYMMENGVDILDISKMLGHQSVETTKIYTHVSNPRLFEIHQKVMS